MNVARYIKDMYIINTEKFDNVLNHYGIRIIRYIYTDTYTSIFGFDLHIERKWENRRWYLRAVKV